jgi:polyferredoxin/formate hydrogenlyase subunit 6/NADH:ubiquinone oxidoreductase subunit I
MVWIRRISQTFFLLLFIFLLVESRLPQAIYVDYSAAFTHEQDLRLSQPVTFFFHLDPLVWLTSLLSGHAWIKGFAWGMGVLVLTLFLGRVFCGFICPFGTLHHAVSRFRPALKGTRLVQATQKSSSQRFKYFLLVALLVSCLLGLNLTGRMDPIAFLFRSVTLAILPGVGVGIRTLFDLMAKSHIKDLNLLSYGAEVLVSPVFGYSYKAFQAGWLIGFLFLVILFLNRIRPRFWCRILCPLGALLGIFSRFSLLKLQKDPEKCTHCKLCTQTCQGGASPMPGQQWESAECLWCFNCFHACPEDALGFGLKWSPRVNKTPDMGRRVVLGGLLVGISLPLLGRLDGRIYKTSDPRLIRPPGSLPEEGFLTLCQRCGLCMKVCPTNVINPTLSEAGMAGFWTPRLVMTQGYCEYSCTLCGSVCPTGAIKEITAQDKTGLPIRIGSAYVNRGRCLPWSGNAPCIVCEEHCPTSPKAIYLQDAVLPGPGGKRLRVQLPYVDLRRCVGCGVCEYKCPVKGRPAIQIIAVGESRSVKNKILLSPT